MNRTQLDYLVKTIPSGTDPEEWRTAACVLTGFSQEKRLNDIIYFYNVRHESAEKWWGYFGFDNSEDASKRTFKRTKQSDVAKTLKSASGQVMSVPQIADLLGKSAVTVYKIISDNRSWFKKISRGQYEIINAEESRQKEKQV